MDKFGCLCVKYFEVDFQKYLSSFSARREIYNLYKLLMICQKVCWEALERVTEGVNKESCLESSCLVVWLFLIIMGHRSRMRNRWVISPWWQRWLLHSKLITLALSPLLITRENQSSFLRPIRGDWTQWVHLGVLIGTNVIPFSLYSQFVRLYAAILCNAFRGTKMHWCA